MSINQNTKIDKAFKFVNGVAYSTVSKQIYEEDAPTSFTLDATSILLQESSLIGSPAPGMSTDVMTYYSAFVMINDTSIATSGLAWYASTDGYSLTTMRATRVPNWIPSTIDPTYTIRIFLVPSNTEIFFSDSTGPLFDYKAGILSFDTSPITAYVGTTGIKIGGYVYDGYKLSDVFSPATGGFTAVADTNMDGYKIINLSAPVSANDAATKQYVDIHAGGGGDGYYQVVEADTEALEQRGKLNFAPTFEITDDGGGDRTTIDLVARGIHVEGDWINANITVSDRGIITHATDGYYNQIVWGENTYTRRNNLEFDTSGFTVQDNDPSSTRILLNTHVATESNTLTFENKTYHNPVLTGDVVVLNPYITVDGYDITPGDALVGQVLTYDGSAYTPAYASGTVGTRANDTSISTSPTVVATYTPPGQDNFIVYIYYRVINATTTVTITLSYTDGNGLEISNIVPGSSMAVDRYTMVPTYINSTASAITITATSGTNGNLFVSCNIVKA